MYKFTAIKSEQSTDEAFESALNCAITCIESVLDKKAIKVVASGNIISIFSIDPDQLTEITATECKEKIKRCFCNDSGQLYSEFSKIKPHQ